MKERMDEITSGKVLDDESLDKVNGGVFSEDANVNGRDKSGNRVGDRIVWAWTGGKQQSNPDFRRP